MTKARKTVALVLVSTAVSLLAGIAIAGILGNPLSGALRVHCRYVEDSDGVMATLRIVDQGGRLCCSVSGLRLRYPGARRRTGRRDRDIRP